MRIEIQEIKSDITFLKRGMKKILQSQQARLERSDDTSSEAEEEAFFRLSDADSLVLKPELKKTL